MKNTVQLVILLILPFLLVSCSKDTETKKDTVTKTPVTQDATSEAKADTTSSDTTSAAPEKMPETAIAIKDVKEAIEEKMSDKNNYHAQISAIDKSNPNWKQGLSLPEAMTFEAGKIYYWDMQTNKGNMSFKLFHESAPMHVSSTIFLTESGFYDDVVFHRVIPGFMAQGGDPTGTGRGGPGYNYAGEFDGKTGHVKPGMLSMANAGPNTDGSQFFITFVPTPFLNGKHTVFGEIVMGQDTLKTLEQFGSASGKTQENLKIEKATIRVE